MILVQQDETGFGQRMLLSLSGSWAKACFRVGLQLSVVFLLLRWELGKVVTGKKLPFWSVTASAFTASCLLDCDETGNTVVPALRRLQLLILSGIMQVWTGPGVRLFSSCSSSSKE